MKTLLFLVMFALALTYDFSDFVRQFNKGYSQDDYAFRQEIFNQNFTLINEINSQNLGYTLNVTNMTDWTFDEMNRYLRAIPNANGLNSKVPDEVMRVSAPKSVDWNRTGRVSPVKDQGYCGSCWAFAVTAAYETYLSMRQNLLYDLSEQYLVECTQYSGCFGGSVDIAYMTVMNATPPGLPLQSSYPYKAYYGTYDPTPGICLTTNKKSFNQYTIMRRYVNVTTGILKSLLTISPVVVAMKVRDFSFSFYSQGIFKCDNTTLFDLNHAVLLIGYDEAGNWFFKNSWGKAWGIGGLGWLSGVADTDCGIKYYAYQVTERPVRLLSSRLMAALGLALTILLSTL